MEDTLQRVFSILLSVMIFFLLPLYMAFEKKDDISYSLALKITSNFVDEVCNKGYMTIDMYNNLVSDLSVTGNSYDISIEHVSKVYNPVIYAYKDGIQYSFDYNLYKRSYASDNNSVAIDGVQYSDATLSYKISEQRYSTEQILRIMDQDAISTSDSLLNKINYTYDEQNKQYIYSDLDLANLEKYKSLNENQIFPVSGLYRTINGKTIYPMNEGDRIEVVIKNTNTTIASILFNTLTFGAKTGADVKVYINYGGTIKNEEYRYTVIDTTITEESTNLEQDNESCQNKGHDFIEVELSECPESIKSEYNYIGIISVDRYGKYSFPANAKVGDIFIAGLYGSGNYEKITSITRGYGTNILSYKVDSLGESYKIDICSRCGEHVR